MDLSRLAAKQLCDFKEVSGLIMCPEKEQTRLKDSLHQKRHGSVIIDSIKVNVGYSTGYGTGMARNRPPTGTSFTILASSISESCRFAAVSQNTTTANQFAFALTSILMQFTGYCNIIQSIYGMVSIANQWQRRIESPRRYLASPVSRVDVAMTSINHRSTVFNGLGVWLIIRQAYVYIYIYIIMYIIIYMV